MIYLLLFYITLSYRRIRYSIKIYIPKGISSYFLSFLVGAHIWYGPIKKNSIVFLSSIQHRQASIPIYEPFFSFSHESGYTQRIDFFWVSKSKHRNVLFWSELNLYLLFCFIKKKLEYIWILYIIRQAYSIFAFS